MRLLLIALFTLWMLTGCTTLPHDPERCPKPEPLIITSTSDVEDLLQYMTYLKKLNATDLNREFETVKQKPKSDSSKLELAILYSLPGLLTHDDAKALAILEPLNKEASATSMKNLAFMMITFIMENKRLEENIQTATNKLKDEQKQSIELQQKLEALKSIEKSLSVRDRIKKPVQKTN